MDKEYELIKKFKKSIIEDNRYFVEEEIIDVFRKVISNKTRQIKKGDIFYRGRIHTSNQKNRYRKNKMYAPPKNIKTHGRFNSFGMNYLYLASDIETVIAELRPDIGAKVTVGIFKAKEKFNYVDLTEEYVVSDTSNLPSLILLLGGLFTLPVSDNDKYIEYIPMQYFAELAKKLDMKAVKYFSSLFQQNIHKYNLGVFDETIFECIDTKVIEIQEIKYKFDLDD